MGTILFNAGKLWLASDEQNLMRRFGEGATLEQLSREFGRTPNAIVGKLRGLGLLFTYGDGHYYPAPETPWAMWQEVQQLAIRLNEEDFQSTVSP